MVRLFNRAVYNIQLKEHSGGSILGEIELQKSERNVGQTGFRVVPTPAAHPVSGISVPKTWFGETANSSNLGELCDF